MPIALKLVTAPAAEPVTVAEVKNYLRIDGSADDAMLGGFITAARIVVENYTGRRLITQTYDLFMDSFPTDVRFDALRDDGVTEGKLSEFLAPRKWLDIPLYPLQSVSFLKTFDDAATEFTMNTSDYFVDTKGEPGRISLTNSSTWPTTYLRPTNGIQIRFVCGYGNASDVPYPFKQAIMNLVGSYYESRGCSDARVPPVVAALLSQYRVVGI